MQEPSAEVLELIIPILAIAGGILVAIVYMVFEAVRKMSQTRSREASRREIAAYVAEGSISPDDAVRLLNSGKSAKAADIKS